MQNNNEKKLAPFMSPVHALAFALGTSIGWGSLVVTANTYLKQAGPKGSILGMIAGGLIMLIIAFNYHYMMNCYPESGGAYAFARDTFGYDYGFLTAWFLMLTYLAMLWANATALPLFAKNFIGNFFHFGYLYTIFGYDVYIGEILLTLAAILGTVLLLQRNNRLPAQFMVILAVVFSLGIFFCSAASILRQDRPVSPEFIPDRSALSQIVKIAVISPWAFIGFENISHFTGEFNFSRKKSFRILSIAVIAAAALYAMVTILSVTAYPEQYGNWLEYIRDLDNQSGYAAFPAFYAAEHYLGRPGILALLFTLAALIISSLIGNIMALSRLFYAMGNDGILPEAFGSLNDKGIPANAMRLVLMISLVIPFVGRTAIGWIVDVTTLGATIIYAIVSAATVKMAKEQKGKAEQWTGWIGLVIMAGFVLYLLIPNLISSGSMETESYFLFAIWAVLGFIFFRWILARDKNRRFGQSIIVWIGLLSLVLFVSLVWMSQSNMTATSRALDQMESHYIEKGLLEEADDIAAQEMEQIRKTNSNSILVVITLFGTSLGVLLSNYSLMSRRILESESQLAVVRNLANTDPLTGVRSKHAYSEKEKALNREIADGVAGPFALAVCDVNGLKYINDTYGHKAGDEYIKQASHLICELFAHSPVYRIGGDEFVVLLSGRDFENRSALLKELHDISAGNIAGEQVVISGGMSEFDPETDREIHAVFERADQLMYTEKAALKALGAKTR